MRRLVPPEASSPLGPRRGGRAGPGRTVRARERRPRPSRSASAVGSASVTPWVLVKNGANRTLTTTRAASRSSLRRSLATSRAVRATSAATSSGSVRSRWNVCSRLRPLAVHPSGCTLAEPSPRPRLASHGPVDGPKRSASVPSSAVASWPTVRIPSSASLAAVLDPMPHSSVVASPCMRLVPAVRREHEHAARLAEPARELGLQAVVPDPDRAPQVRAFEHPLLDPLRERLGIVGRDGQERLVPPRDLDLGVERSQRVHDLAAGGEVRARVDREEDRVGVALVRGSERHRAPDPERARLVARGRDHPALARIAVAADDDRPALELGATEPFDRRDELVEIEVEHEAPSHGASIANRCGRGGGIRPASHVTETFS